MQKLDGIKIIIHTCNKREWYVYNYLIPSLLQQGFQQQEIKVWHDYSRVGNLRSFIGCMEWVFKNLQSGAAAWHLQDDILISKNFKNVIEKDYQGVACGFCYSGIGGINVSKVGRVPASQMWFSFPCIRIPNKYCGEFVEWLWGSRILKGARYFKWFQTGKMDDTFFYQFMMREHHREFVENICPNIVEHVDWLIGGTVINDDRKQGVVRAFYWEQEDLVKDLQKKLEGKV